MDDPTTMEMWTILTGFEWLKKHKNFKAWHRLEKERSWVSSGNNWKGWAGIQSRYIKCMCEISKRKWKILFTVFLYIHLNLFLLWPSIFSTVYLHNNDASRYAKLLFFFLIYFLPVLIPKISKAKLCFCSLPYQQDPEQCLAQSWYPESIC